MDPSDQRTLFAMLYTEIGIGRYAIVVEGVWEGRRGGRRDSRRKGARRSGAGPRTAGLPTLYTNRPDTDGRYKWWGPEAQEGEGEGEGKGKSLYGTSCILKRRLGGNENRLGKTGRMEKKKKMRVGKRERRERETEVVEEEEEDEGE